MVSLAWEREDRAMRTAVCEEFEVSSRELMRKATGQSEQVRLAKKALAYRLKNYLKRNDTHIMYFLGFSSETPVKRMIAQYELILGSGGFGGTSHYLP